ncbi:MAG: 7-carboxy-7-deazaguanine synthase QueE [Chitinophagales bacterium]
MQEMTLPVMEHFYTLQGEGAYQGKAAYFIRLGGCAVGCTWCDVKDSWDAAKHPHISITVLVDAVKKSPAHIVVITGGEPLMYDLGALTNVLQAEGYRTHLETSGAYPLSGNWDWICFSPKKFKQPLPEIAEKAHELKVIVYNKHDLEWAEQHQRMVHVDCLLFLQPEWSKKEVMMPVLVNYVKEHPVWRISLQMHKYLDIP